MYLFKIHSSPLGNVQYCSVPSGEAFLQIRKSTVIGFGGSSTGRGIFTLKPIPPGTWITSYAPTAPFHLARSTSSSDYILRTVRNNTAVQVDGALCPLGLGKIIQDGSFPLIIAQEKFGSLVKSRLNCEWVNREGEIWFKSTRAIRAGEELFTRYTRDNSYWTVQYTSEQLQAIKTALMSAPGSSLEDAERVIRRIKL